MNPIAIIHAALRSIRLGASVLVAGVMVVRSSLLGFDIGRQRGLDADLAVTVIAMIVTARASDAAAECAELDAIDASWPAPVAILPAVAPVAKGPSVKSTTPTFYAKMIEAVAPYRGVYGMNLRNVNKGDVAISVSAGRGVSADEHRMAALLVAEALRNDGYAATSRGNDVMVFAA